MVINIMSRSEAKQAAYKLSCKTAIISINNACDEITHFHQSPNLIAVLPLTFDDVGEDGEFCMAKDSALQIRNFLELIGQKIDRLIVHCEFGVSRSAGVAAAILKALSGNDSAIFDDPKFYPNMLCYRLVLDALLDEDGNLNINPIECVFSAICSDNRMCAYCPKHEK